jgi:16S rRNA (adenine1518-N6/adenine1519-N6)-dimethyltransferase
VHKAKKKFGQNFLVDEQIIGDIISAIHPDPEDNMVEIGPGLGALTRPLLNKLNHLHVVEIDRDIIARLEHDYPQGNAKSKLTIHAGDALEFDIAMLPAPLRIVGNLPYNISSPLLFHFSKYAARITDMHFMLQNEVVERIHARIREAVGDVAISFPDGKIARCAARIFSSGAQGKFRHRAHDSITSQ